MYVYKVLHHLSDNLKDKGLRVRVGLGLDLSLSLSLLGLVPFPFLFILAKFGFAHWALNSSPLGHLMCCPLACTVTIVALSPHISWYIKPSLPLFIKFSFSSAIQQLM